MRSAQEAEASVLDAEQAHLVKMANQIAANAPVPSASASQVATHLRTFWTPAMCAELVEIAKGHPGLLRADVISALESLASVTS